MEGYACTMFPLFPIPNMYFMVAFWYFLARHSTYQGLFPQDSTHAQLTWSVASATAIAYIDNSQGFYNELCTSKESSCKIGKTCLPFTCLLHSRSIIYAGFAKLSIITKNGIVIGIISWVTNYSLILARNFSVNL